MFDTKRYWYFVYSLQNHRLHIAPLPRVVRTSLVRYTYISKYGLRSDAVRIRCAAYSLETSSPASCPQAPLMSPPKLALRVQAISLLVSTSSNARKDAGLGALNLSGWPLLSLTGL